MFTGIIEEIGYIKSIKKSPRSIMLTVGCRHVLEDVHQGDSIAMNGVCLTVTSYTDHFFTADVMPETVNLTNLRQLEIGSAVNLERAMSVNSRFGGHIVAGHIDGVGRIKSIRPMENAVIFTVSTTPSITEFIIYKGSVAIDGASLTVTAVSEDEFSVSLIPHTVTHTLLGKARVGTIVNIETDMLGRYIAKFMHIAKAESPVQKGLTTEKLYENGFF